VEFRYLSNSDNNSCSLFSKTPLLVLKNPAPH
jgi:hypothetical protein